MAFTMDSMEAARAALALTEVSGPIVTSTKGFNHLSLPPLLAMDNGAASLPISHTPEELDDDDDYDNNTGLLRVLFSIPLGRSPHAP